MDLIAGVKTGVILVSMELPEAVVNVGLHKFPLNLWQNYSGKFLYQHNFWSIVFHYNFYQEYRLYNTSMVWYCRFYLSTGLWKCNRVFDRGDGLFGKLLCTTERRIASCAGYQMGLEYGWLCTTGTDSDFCAGNLFLFSQSQMSLMSNVAESVIGTKFLSFLIFANCFAEVIFNWVWWLCHGTVFWRGEVVFCRLLCTTEGQVASCAGHQVGFGWLCTTGTDPNFCAGMMYWIMQPQMSLMIMRLLGDYGWRSYCFMFAEFYSLDGLLVWYYLHLRFALILTFLELFVFWLGYEVVNSYRNGALYGLIFWFYNINMPCTLFPCSKFSLRVFIWQGFLTRQGFGGLVFLMIHPLSSLMISLRFSWSLPFKVPADHVLLHLLIMEAGRSYSAMVYWFIFWLSFGYQLCIVPMSIFSILAFLGQLWMVMFGAPLVDSLGVPHVFRVCNWSKVRLSIY